MRVIIILLVMAAILIYLDSKIERDMEFQRNAIDEVIGIPPAGEGVAISSPVIVWDAVHMNYSDANKYLKRDIKAKLSSKNFSAVIILNKEIKKLGADAYIHGAEFKVVHYPTKVSGGIFRVYSATESIWYDVAIDVARWINDRFKF